MSDVARRLKERTEKNLVLPSSGETVRIRKLDHLQFIKDGGNVLIAAIDAALRDDQAPVPTEEASDYIAQLLQHCLIEPRLHLGDDPCPEDAVTLAHLSDDLAWLINEVLVFNAASKEAAAMAASFRAAVRTAIGSNGEGLREVADRSPGNGPVAPDDESPHLPRGEADD